MSFINRTSKEIIEGTEDELVTWLDRLPKGNKIIGLEAVNPAKLLKKSRETKESNPFGAVLHATYRTASLGVIYSAAVNRARVAAVSDWMDDNCIDYDVEIDYFHPESLWGGKGERESSHIVRHSGSGRRYLAFRPHKLIAERWQGIDGSVLTLDDLRPFLPSPKATGTVSVDVEGSTIEVEKPPFRCQGLDGISAVVYGNTVFQVTR